MLLQKKQKSGKLIQPRKLHNTQWGVICPSETPEGSSVGLVKNIAIASTITTNSDSRCVREHINNMGIVIITKQNIHDTI